MKRTQAAVTGYVFTATAVFCSIPQVAQAQLTCDGAGEAARCTMTITDGLTFEADAGATTTADNPFAVRMTGDVILITPAQDFKLMDADLVFLESADGETLPFELYGSARAPLGDMGLTDDMLTVSPMAAMGVVSRTTLRRLLDDEDNPLPLAENDSYGVEPAYLFFHFASGLELDLKLSERLGLNTDEGASDPFQYAFPGDVAITLIFDPTDPYVYITSDGRKLLTGENEAEDQATSDEPDQENESESESEARKDSKTKGKTKTDNDTEDSSGGSSISVGSFALSGHGGIPFEPEYTWGLPENVRTFKGHVYVETTIPLGYGIELSGPVVTHASADGFEQGGNGEVTVGFALLGDIIGLEFHLGQASAGYGVRSDREYAYFSGTMSPDDSFLPDWVPIVPTTEVNVAAYIDGAHIEDTRLMAKARYELDAGNLGRMTGIDLNELMVREGELTIDRHGIWLRGRTATNLHPDLVFGSEVVVEAFISAEDVMDSYILLRGDMSIGGATLGAEAEARVSGRGVFLSGSFDTPISRIALEGAIDRNGPRLTGLATIDFDFGGLRQAQQDADRDLQNAIAEVAKLDYAINDMRNTVAKERQRDSKNVSDARAEVAAQQAEVDRLQSLINSNKSSIASHNGQIKKWRNWYNRKKWYEKTWAWAKYLSKTAPHYAAIAKHGAAIGGLEVAKATATGALLLAQEVLRGVEQSINVFPIDADPRVAGLIAARDVARETLKAARAAVTVVEIPDGELVGEIRLTVSIAGVESSIVATYDGYELIDGWVELDEDPRACVDLPAFKEVCAAF